MSTTRTKDADLLETVEEGSPNLVADRSKNLRGNPSQTVAARPPAQAPPPMRATAPRSQAAPTANDRVPRAAPAAAGHPQPKVDEAFKPGDHVRHYELIRPLGRGGMGTVFLARDSKLGRRVAIKFLNAQDPELARRFVVEARATARCSHENIVILYEADEVQGRPYMVLEYLHGAPLTKLLGDGKPLAPGRAVELVAPVVRALACAHAQGIVHRDLKPDNIFLTDTGTLKVLDFGIAKVLQGEAQQPTGADVHLEGDAAEVAADLTHHGVIMGSLAYMSPEQWGVGGPIDHRTDIWAVGIILFKALSGRHPLEGVTGLALAITGNLTVPMPRLSTVAPEVPSELCEVVDRCLAKRKEERLSDALALLRALEPFLPGRFTRELKIDESPYAGLASFQESDAGRFFGRTAEIAAVVNRVRDQPMVAVVGPSGAGKSSFVRAGVVPAIKRSGESWEAMVIRPGRDPLSALASVVAPMLSTSSTVETDLQEQRALVERLRAEPGFMGSVLRSRARRDKKSILLFVDQFEELYTLCDELRERLAFTACLAGVADDATSPTRVVVSIRSDFLDRVPESSDFMVELSRGLFFLQSPHRDGLREALAQPAEMAGYRFESPAIVEDMLEHLQTTPGALPLLQFAAMKLWEGRDPSRKLLTESSYTALGGIAGALAAHADSVLSELPPRSRPLVRSLWMRLVTPERTRAIVSLDELRELTRDPEEVGRLIDHLVQARLWVVQTGGGVATAEIVHESLIHSWPTLRRWLDESGEDAAFLEQLRTAARQWHAKGRDPGLLWRGEMVEEARRFQRRYRGELPQQLVQFLEAVFVHQARAVRRLRAMTVGGLVILSLLVAASAVALVVIRRAQQEAVRQANVAQKAEEVARVAEGEARQRLEEVQRKEGERGAAVSLAQAARSELETKNEELEEALTKTEGERQKAREAQAVAEQNAQAAAEAKEDVKRHATRVEALLKNEKDRADRLEKEIGRLIEMLK